MNKLLLFFIIIFNHILANSQITFQKTYGTSALGTVSGLSAKQIDDGGYIMTGWTYLGSSEIYVVKTDQYGILQWSKTFGDGSGSGMQEGMSIMQTYDSGYIISGYVNSSMGNGHFLLKMDNNGNMQWSNVYDGGGFQVVETVDSGFAMVSNGIYMAKTDSIGNVDWARRYGGTNYQEYGYRIIQNSDKGFILAGHSASFGAGGTDFYIVNTDSVGNILWTKTYGGSGGDVLEDIKPTFDGGYILSGESDSWSNVLTPYLIKTDGNGNIQWSKVYIEVNCSDWGLSVCQTSDSGFAVACTTATVFKTDNNGSVLWAKNYKQSNWADTKSIHETDDGGLVIFGSYSWKEFYLIKTDQMGNTGCFNPNITITDSSVSTFVGSGGTFGNAGTQSNSNPVIAAPMTITNILCPVMGVNEVTPKNNISVFPNPASDYVNLSLSSQERNLFFSFFDIFGREAIKGELQTDTERIAVNNLSSGIYLLQIHSSDKIYRTKIIVE